MRNRHRFVWKICLGFGMVVIWEGATAQLIEPIVTDRPDFTESPAIVPAGHIQIEGGYTFASTGEDKSHSIGELLARIGAASDLEFRVGLNSHVITQTPAGSLSGFQDASLGLKFNFVNVPASRGRFAFSILAGSSIPTGSLLYTNDRAVPEIKNAFSLDLSERTLLSWNLNYAYAMDDGDRFNQFSGSVSIGFALSPAVGTYLEYYGYWPADSHGKVLHYLNGGATFLITNDVQTDVRVGKGVNSVQPDYFVGVGGAVRL